MTTVVNCRQARLDRVGGRHVRRAWPRGLLRFEMGRHGLQRVDSHRAQEGGPHGSHDPVRVSVLHQHRHVRRRAVAFPAHTAHSRPELRRRSHHLCNRE